MTDRQKGDSITGADLDIILDVNKKAIEIHTEVGRQYEEIMEDLEMKQKSIDELQIKIDGMSKTIHEIHSSVKQSIEKKIDEMEKNLFRLIAILTTIGVGTIIAIVQSYLRK